MQGWLTGFQQTGQMGADALGSPAQTVLEGVA
jgi:hypothetical protein